MRRHIGEKKNLLQLPIFISALETFCNLVGLNLMIFFIPYFSYLVSHLWRLKVFDWAMKFIIHVYINTKKRVLVNLVLDLFMSKGEKGWLSQFAPFCWHFWQMYIAILLGKTLQPCFAVRIITAFLSRVEPAGFEAAKLPLWKVMIITSILQLIFVCKQEKIRAKLNYPFHRAKTKIITRRA